MDASVLVYKNHHRGGIGGCELQVLVSLISDHSPEKFRH